MLNNFGFFFFENYFHEFDSFFRSEFQGSNVGKLFDTRQMVFRLYEIWNMLDYYYYYFFNQFRVMNFTWWIIIMLAKKAIGFVLHWQYKTQSNYVQSLLKHILMTQETIDDDFIFENLVDENKIQTVATCGECRTQSYSTRIK